jgi:polyferredoxin
MKINKGPDRRRDIPLSRKIRHVLPSRSYLKTYAWMLFVFLLVLAVVSYLFGRYLGYQNALAGGLAIGVVVIAVFLAALAAGVLLHIIDRER